MADDITLPGTGVVVRSDDVGGVQYQVFKLDVGADGATLPLSASNPAPVQIPDLVATGNLTAAAQTVVLNVNGCANAGFQITGTFSATLQFEATVDGSTYFVLNVVATNTTIGASVTSTTAAGAWLCTVAGFAAVRVRCSAYTSGTAVVTIRGSVGYGMNGFPVTTRLSLINNASVSAGNQSNAGSGTQAVTIVGDSTGQIAAIGKAAAGATISGAPVLNGGAARTANPTAVTDGQVANLMVDKLGKQVVIPALRELVGMQTTTITSSTAETTIVTAVASTFLDITHLDITNTSATATVLTIKDSTAGTTRATYALGAGGALALDFNPPMPQGAVNTNWTLTSSVSISSLYCNCTFIRNV